ncbi:7SK snRNA methylphosphate capping enzyme-like isoform X2 [Eriocheir sinensis]|nr:7SK snRNA methylphosphate capping enzyme-like isoform X2 [Eriocheir sinensis]XP_050714368.1 7SK snRNA methylphosphate capping enzyme-like isoform X2 [Eriocheir sinensis]
MSSELGVERPTSLALSEAQGVERRVHFSEVDRPRLVATSTRQSTTPTTPSPRKPRQDPDFKPKRKRSMSFSLPGEHRFGNRWWHKRTRVLPSKFLLGGSITDPLNLGSLDKEEVVQTTTETPATGGGGGSGVSKRSAAVRVIIPPNINDPLNLDASSDNEDSHTDALQRQQRRRRRRKRKRRLSEPADGPAGREGDGDVRLEALQARASSGSPSRPSQITFKPLTINTDLFSPPGVNESRRDSGGGQPVTPTGTKGSGGGSVQRPPFKKQRHKSDNKIVSPVIPQPGGDRKRHPSYSRQYSERPHLSQQNLQPPKSYNSKNELFQYGNYNKYYGYRNPDQAPDVRLEHLKREWFEGRDVLDIGCNIGHVSLTVARDFNPKRVVGIDIDKKLVNIAQKNIKHYMRKGDAEEGNFPRSMRLLYGPLKPPVQADGQRSFPHNVKFVHGNYVLESDELLETVRPEFDLVLCLSITKWIHLNWGDAGLKRFFRRIFHNLRPGGRLVLEPQAWPSYNKRRKLTKHIFENYKSIRFFPDKFNDFLLHEVGFSTSEKLVTPNHTSRGFQRPIIIYTKAGSSSKSSPMGESGATTTATTTTATTTTSATAVTPEDEVFTSEVTGHGPDQVKGRRDTMGKRKRHIESGEGVKGMQESQPALKAQKHEQHQHQQQHKKTPSVSQAKVPNCGKAAASSLSSSSSAPAQEVEKQVCDSSVTDNLVLRVDGDKATSTTTTTTSSPSSNTDIHTSSPTISTTTLPIPNIPTTMTTGSVLSTSRHSPNSLSSSASQGREDSKTTPHTSSPTTSPHLNCSKSKVVEMSMKTVEDRNDSKKMTEEKGECRDRVSEEGNLALPTASSPTSVNERYGGESTTHTLEKRKTSGCDEEEKTNKRVRLEDT